MHILLVAATAFEIRPTLDFLGQAEHGLTGNISTLITGVGSVATTCSLLRQTAGNPPDIIIQAGIAGTFVKRQPGEVLVVGEESWGDLGVWEEDRFKTVFDLKLADPAASPYAGGRLVNPHQRLLSLAGLPVVRGITVNEITTDPVRIAWHQQNTQPVVESMEGAALHYVCLTGQISFIQFRSVSNEVGVRDKSKWTIGPAIGNLNEKLIAFLKKLA